MAYLIIDTETNGLNPVVDKVIEIGGIVAEFNIEKNQLEYIASYHSLIYMESMLDEKVTNLTGITLEDLQNAPKKHVVQEEWDAFLDKYKITHILGHSLIFDTSFLKGNGFNLPKAIEIDTLDFAKIVLIDSKALNLDFINQSNDLNQYFPRPEELSLLNHHRALYDAFLAGGLYNFLFKRLKELSISTDFIFSLEHFLTQKTSLNENIIDIDLKNQEEKIDINIFSKNIKEDNKSIFKQILNQGSAYDTISHLYISLKGKNVLYKKIILEIWFALLNVNILDKVSLNGGVERKFYDLIITSLGYEEKIIDENYNLIAPEQIINENKDFTSINTSTLDLIDYLTIYDGLKFECSQLIGLVKLSQSKILSSLKGLTNTNYYSLNIKSATMEHADLINAINSYIGHIDEVITKVKENFTNTLLEIILSKYIKKTREILITESEVSFFFHDNDVKIYQSIPYNLSEFIDKLAEKSDIIKTTLTPKEYLKFVELMKVKGHQKVEYGDEIMIENTTSIIDKLKVEGDKCKIIFIGKSSNLKSFPVKLKNEGVEYLDLSNVGSATKILSKIANGYKGVIVMSYKNIDYLANFVKKEIDYMEFYFYGDIFLALTKSIKDLNIGGINQFDFDKQIARLYLKFLLYKLYSKFGKKINMYPEIK
jgi:DNA polymerase III epsilon subunit-like protein